MILCAVALSSGIERFSTSTGYVSKKVPEPASRAIRGDGRTFFHQQ